MTHFIRIALGCSFLFSLTAFAGAPAKRGGNAAKEAAPRGDQSATGRFTNYSGKKGCDGNEKDESKGGTDKPTEHTWEKAGQDKNAWAMIAVDANIFDKAKGCTGTLHGRKVKVADTCGACHNKGLNRVDVSRDCGSKNRLPSDELPPGTIQWDPGCHLDQKGYGKPSIDSQNKCKGGAASKDCQAAPEDGDMADSQQGDNRQPADAGNGPGSAGAGKQGGDANNSGGSSAGGANSGEYKAPPACTPDGSVLAPGAGKCCSGQYIHRQDGMLQCGKSYNYTPL